MTHDPLRAILADLAAEAPIELRRSEQVWARHRRTRRRVVAMAVGAALVVFAGSCARGVLRRGTGNGAGQGAAPDARP